MLVSGRLISGSYSAFTDRLPLLYLVIRTAEDKKTFVEPFRSKIKPYFYLKKENQEEVRMHMILRGIDESRFKFVDCPDFEFATDSGKVVRCDLFEPYVVGDLKRDFRKIGIELFEADIPYIRRLMIDLGVKAGITVDTETGDMTPYNGKLPKPKFLYIDIEIDDSRGFPEDAGKYAILCISTTNEKGETKYYTWEYGRNTEEEMLEKFFDDAMEYDYLIVWNKDFESEQLPARFKELDIYREWRIFQWIDLADFFRMFHQETFFEKLPIAYRRVLKKYRTKLDRIGIIINEERIKRLPGYYKAWKNEPQTLKEVNISHSYALYVMEKAMEVIGLYSDVADEVGLFLESAHMNSHVVDTLALRLINEANKKWVASSTGAYDDKKKGFRGAVVFPAKRGVHPFVFLFDFTSLYNRIIQSYYLDPIAYYRWNGTFAKDGVKEYLEFAKMFGQVYGVKVGDDRLPIFPAILNIIEQRRNFLKDERKKYIHGTAEYEEFDQKQKAAKVILLACYGVLGMSSSRWTVIKKIPEELILWIKTKADEESADFRMPNEPKEKFVGMVTYLARTSLIETRDFFNNDPNVQVIYSDTDSAFVRPLNLIGEYLTYKDLTDEDLIALKAFGDSYGEKLEEFYKTRFESGIEMKLEKIADRGIFGKVKKQYYLRIIYDEDSGWQKDKGKLSWYEYYKGLPLVRSDRNEFLKEQQRKTLQIMLDDPTKLYDMWKTVISDFFAGKYNSQLIMRIGIKRHLDTYDRETPVIKVAKMLQAQGQTIRPGEKVAFIIVDVQKNRPVPYPVDETLDPEEAIKLVPKPTKKALDYYWKNVWKNVKPFLELVLEEDEILKIKYAKDGWTLIANYL